MGRFTLSLLAGLAGVSLAACSIVNAPDDPLPLASSGGQGGTAGPGGGGQGGDGGDGGSGGSVPMCGNGTVEMGEDCDGMGVETVDCNVDCTTAACGDSKVNRAASEQCDDGNTDAGDACSPNCQASAFVVDPKVVTGNNYAISTRPTVVITPRDGEERFLVAWNREDPSDTMKHDAVLSVFDVNGAALSSLLPLSTGDEPIGMSMAANSQGRIVATWATADTPRKLRFRIIEPGGMPSGPGDAALPQVEPSSQPVVASNGNDGFCMMWRENTTGVERARCLSAAGALTGVNSDIDASGPGSLANAYGPRLLIGTANGYVAGYVNANGFLAGRALTSAGTTVGNPFQLFTQSMAHNGHFAAGTGSDSEAFTITAGINDLHGSMMDEELRTMLASFSAPGMPVGTEKLVTDIHQSELLPFHLRLGDGPIVATWTRPTPNGDVCTLHMRIIGANGMPMTPEIELDGTPDRCNALVRGAVNSAGDVMLSYLRLNDTGDSQIMGLIFRRMLEP